VELCAAIAVHRAMTNSPGKDEMTCRRCRGDHQQQYEIADVQAFLPTSPTRRTRRGGTQKPATDASADVDAGTAAPSGDPEPAVPDYRYAWNG
jgi:hypothetical protein